MIDKNTSIKIDKIRKKLVKEFKDDNIKLILLACCRPLDLLDRNYIQVIRDWE